MTGIGLPHDPAGADSVVFFSGANGRDDVSDIHAATPAIEWADMLLLQLELRSTRLTAAKLAGQLGTRSCSTPPLRATILSPDGLAHLVVGDLH